MYENVNTADRANAIPALPSLTVMRGAGHDEQDVEADARQVLDELPDPELVQIRRTTPAG